MSEAPLGQQNEVSDAYWTYSRQAPSTKLVQYENIAPLVCLVNCIQLAAYRAPFSREKI
jgi:hypothetical protein